MNYYHILTIIAGLAVLASGFWASFEARKPWNIIGSIAAPIGLLVAILGTLLLCVPTFFNPVN